MFLHYFWLFISPKQAVQCQLDLLEVSSLICKASSVHTPNDSECYDCETHWGGILGQCVTNLLVDKWCHRAPSLLRVVVQFAVHFQMQIDF